MSTDDRSTIPPAPDAETLLALVRAVRGLGYGFTTVTPATHARVNARPDNARARSLRDVLGWSRPFRAGLLPDDLVGLMRDAGVLAQDEEGLRTTIRLSSLDDELFVHSAYPPTSPDAVFFGPDTVRFVSAVIEHLKGTARPIRRAVDIGCGSGAAGIAIAKRCPGAQVVLVDVNPAALRTAGINARLAGVDDVELRRSDMLRDVDGDFDLIVSNPPFMIDRTERAYRHGGGALGAGLSLGVVKAAVARLAPGGTLVLFTGAAIVEGEDLFRAEAGALCEAGGLRWSYREYDPDAYGEELDDPAYARAERIALVVLTAAKP